MRWMIKGATPLPQSEAPGELKPIDVVIDGNEIVAIGSAFDSKKFRAAKVLSAADKLIIPGLINAHLHSHDRFDKGRFDNLPLEVWMARYNPPTAARDWTARECYLRTLLGGIEMIKSGTTAFNDMYFMMEETARAVDELGLRAVLSYGFIDLFDEERKENAVKLIGFFRDIEEGDRIRRDHPDSLSNLEMALKFYNRAEQKAEALSTEVDLLSITQMKVTEGMEQKALIEARNIESMAEERYEQIITALNLAEWEKARKILDTHQPAPLPEDVDRELREIIKHAEAEMGDTP